MPPITLRRNLDAEQAPGPTNSTTYGPANGSTFASTSCFATPATAAGPTPTKQAVHETATEQQIAATPPGTLAHRHYVCPSLQKERAKHAPQASSTGLRCEPKATS